jgi:hypothetical protein
VLSSSLGRIIQEEATSEDESTTLFRIVAHPSPIDAASYSCRRVLSYTTAKISKLADRLMFFEERRKWK